MIKKILFIIGILLLISTCYANPVTDTSTFAYETAINVSWSGTATNYTILLENESVIYIEGAPPTVDGIIEPYYQNLSYTYTILTPNPIYLNQLDSCWALVNDTYEWYAVDGHDNDASPLDDALKVYIDLSDDGLTNGDLMYEYYENGEVVRYRYNSGNWVQYPGSGAVAAVTGGGTEHFEMEIRVPLVEIDPSGFVNGSYHRVMLVRSHDYPPELFRYYPHLLTGLDVDDSSTWARIEHAYPNTTGYTFVANTTNEFYNVTDLYPYNWYRIWIVPDGNFSEIVKVTNVTSNPLQYSVSGYVYDYDTGNSIFNAKVFATYSGSSIKEVYTNISGHFEIEGLYNEYTYTINATKDNYDSDSSSILIADGNTTGLEYYLKYNPETTGVETATTDIKIVYILILLMLVLFAISLWTLYVGEGEVNAITFFTMAIPFLIAFKVSNLFIDGTLVTTEKFLTSIDTVIVQEDVIRNTAMSNLFELLGICFLVGTLLQIYYYLKDSGLEEEL